MKKKLLSIILALFIFSAACQQKEVFYKYNTSNGKYHKLDCKWAKKCTKNCEELTLKEIKDKKGIPCKVCKPPK